MLSTARAASAAAGLLAALLAVVLVSACAATAPACTLGGRPVEVVATQPTTAGPGFAIKGAGAVWFVSAGALQGCTP